jgi:hypothetical protein
MRSKDEAHNQRLPIKQSRLALDERKYELEKEERECKFQFEKEDREHRYELEKEESEMQRLHFLEQLEDKKAQRELERETEIKIREEIKLHSLEMQVQLKKLLGIDEDKSA